MRLSIVSTFGIVEAIEWKMPPVSMPSANVRAPAPPPELFMSGDVKGMPRRSRPAKTITFGIDDQAACASSRNSSEAEQHLREGVGGRLLGCERPRDRGHAGRRRRHRVVDGPLLGDDLDDAARGADRPGHVVAEEHEEDAVHRTLECGAGAVDRPRRLLGGAGEVDDQPVVGLRQEAADLVELVLVAVVVEVDLVEPRAVGDLAQLPADDALDVVDDLGLAGEEGLDPVVGDELVDPPMGDGERRHAGPEVERVVLGRARVAQEDGLGVAGEA